MVICAAATTTLMIDDLVAARLYQSAYEIPVGLSLLQGRSCYGVGDDDMGPHVKTRPLRRRLLRWSFFSKVRFTVSRRSDDDDTGGNLDDGPHFGRVCVQFVLVARLAMCVLEAVVFHDGRRGCLYRF